MVGHLPELEVLMGEFVPIYLYGASISDKQITTPLVCTTLLLFLDLLLLFLLLLLLLLLLLGFFALW